MVKDVLIPALAFKETGFVFQILLVLLNANYVEMGKER